MSEYVNLIGAEDVKAAGWRMAQAALGGADPQPALTIGTVPTGIPGRVRAAVFDPSGDVVAACSDYHNTSAQHAIKKCGERLLAGLDPQPAEPEPCVGCLRTEPHAPHNHAILIDGHAVAGGICPGRPASDPDTQKPDALDIGMRSAVGEGAKGLTATTYPADPQPTEPEPDGPTQAHSAGSPAPPHSSGEKVFVAPCGRTDEHKGHGRAGGIQLCHGKLTWERGTRPPCGHDGLCMSRWRHGTFGGVCVAFPPHWVDLGEPRPASDPDTQEVERG